jgi:hypothetical protein
MLIPHSTETTYNFIGLVIHTFDTQQTFVILVILFSILAFTLGFLGTQCNYLLFTSFNSVANDASCESKPILLHFGWYYKSWVVAEDSAVVGRRCEVYPASISIDKK